MKNKKAIFMTLFSIISIGLTGCVMKPSTDAYYPIPLSYHTEPDQPQTITARYPAVLNPEGMMLPEIIKIALENNFEIAVSVHESDASMARIDQSKSVTRPVLTAEGGYSLYLDDQRLIPARSNGDPGAFSNSIFSGDMVVRMPLYAGGRYVNAIKAEELLGDASEYNVNRIKNEVVFNVTRVFYNILAQDKILESLSFSKDALESHIKRVNNLIDLKKAAKVDLLRTEVRLADINQRILAENNTLMILKRTLINLMGINPGEGEVKLKGDFTENTYQPFSPEESLQTALEQRPDYLAAKKILESQAKKVDMARSGHYPSINLFGSYGGRWAAGGSAQGSSDEFSDTGKIGVGIEVPLFNWGRVDAQIREEYAKLEASRKRLDKLKDMIRLETESALLLFNSISERIQMLKKAIEQAREGLRIEQQKYELGKGVIVDVLDSQTALLESETNYYIALGESHVALAQINLVTGGLK